MTSKKSAGSRNAPLNDRSDRAPAHEPADRATLIAMDKWALESMLLEQGAFVGDLAGLRAVLARHDLATAQWAPRHIHNALFYAILGGHEEIIALLAPLADVSDDRSMRRLTQAAAAQGDESIAQSFVLHCMTRRWKTVRPWGCDR